MAKLTFDILANDGVSKVLDNIQSKYSELEKAARKAGVSVKESLSDGVSGVREVGSSFEAQLNYIKGLKSQLSQLSVRRSSILGKGSHMSSSEHSELLKINKQYNEITKAIGQEEAALKQLGNTFLDSMKTCDKELKSFEKELGKAAKPSGGAGKFKSALADIGKMAAGVFTVQKLVQFAKKVTQVRGEMQALDAAFTTMLGSKAASDALIQEGIEFAATTPFDLQQVAKGMKQLLAFGTEQENVINDMRMLGDVAAGLTIPIGDLIYLYGTLRAQGRVMTIDIRQFAMRGIPIYDELAKVLGVAKSELQEMISTGQVAFEHVEQAFKNMTSEGGKFAGLTQGIAGTIQGRISNLGDAIYQMFNEIGQKTEGIINTVLNVASVAVENYEKIGKAVGNIIAAYGTYRAALMLNAAVSRAVTAKAIANNAAEAASVGNVTAAYLAKMKLLRGVAFLKSGGGILSIVAGLTAATIKYNMSIVDGTQAQKAYNRNLEKQNALIEDNKKKTQQQLAVIDKMNEGSAERNDAIKALVEEYPELLKQYDLEKLALMDIKQLNEDIERIQSQRAFDADMTRLDELYARLAILNRTAEDFKAAGGAGLMAVQKKIKEVEYEISAIEGKHGQNLFFGPVLPSGEGANTEEAEVKNKEYWEKQRDKAESALEGLTLAELNSAAAKELKRQYDEAVKNIEKYDLDTKEDKGKEKAGNDIKKAEEELAKAVQEQKEEARLYNKKGDEKELLDMKIAHDKKIKELEEQKRELEALYKKDGGITEERKQTLAQFDALIATEEQRYDVQVSDYHKNKFKELEEKYKGFQTQLDELNREYSAEVEIAYQGSDINKTQEILAEIEKVYREKLGSLYDAISSEGGKINEAFTNTLGGPMLSAGKWLETLGEKSLSDLTMELSNLQSQLDVFSTLGMLSEEEAASLKLMIELLQDTIARNTSGVEKNKTSWTDLQSVLDSVGGSFQQIGQEIGGVAGKAISLVGDLATSVTKLGNALETLNAKGDNGEFLASAAERATASLSVVSVAFSVVSEVIGLMRSESERSLEVARKAYDYERALAKIRRERERYEENAFGEDVHSRFLVDYAVLENQAYKSIEKVRAYLNLATMGMAEALMPEDELNSLVESLYERIWGENKDLTLTVDMRTDLQKFLGSSNNIIEKDWADFFLDGELQGEELREWFETYKENLSSVDAAFIQSVLDDWEAYQEAFEGIKDYITSLVGDISGSIANDMVEQFLETGSAILDMSSYLEDFSKNLAKSIIQSRLLNKVFTDEAQDEIASMIASGDTESAINAYNALLEQANGLAPEIQAWMEGIGLTAGQAAQTASGGGFQTMSQDTGTELNGRFTAVQIANEATRAAMEMLSYDFNSFLLSYNSRSLVVDDIRNIQAQSLLELMAINENTRLVIKPIREMNTTMAEMNNKIKTL